jgi:hypothetical protein
MFPASAIRSPLALGAHPDDGNHKGDDQQDDDDAQGTLFELMGSCR